MIFDLEIAHYKSQKVEFSFDDFSSNEPAVNWLTDEHKGPLIRSLTEPAKQNKSGSAGDKLIMQALERNSKTFLKDTNLNKQGQAIFQNFSNLKGRKVFDGIHGGPYGLTTGADGKPQNDSKDVQNDIGVCPAFGVEHYAADVAYDLRGWTEKDKSIPAPEMSACFSVSGDSFFMAPEFSKEEKPNAGN